MYNVNQVLIKEIVQAFRSQNVQIPKTRPPLPVRPKTSPVVARVKTEQELNVQQMKNDCPEESKEQDPITYSAWKDNSYKEFVKNDKYLSQCYLLSKLLGTFKGQLESKKLISISERCMWLTATSQVIGKPCCLAALTIATPSALEIRHR